MSLNINKSLTFRIVFYVLSLCVFLFIISLSVFYFFSKSQLEKMTYKNAEMITTNTVLQIEQILNPIMKIADNYKWQILKMESSPDSIILLTRRIVQ